MGKKKIPATALFESITAELNEFHLYTNELVAEVMDEVSEEALYELEHDANVPKDTGDYAKSFYIKKTALVSGRKTNIIANKKGQLTHLLENDHLSRKGIGNKGKPAKKSNPNSQDVVKGHSHWAEAEKIVETLPERIQMAVNEYYGNH